MEDLEIYNTFERGKKLRKAASSKVEKFKNSFKPSKNVTYERFMLMKRKQKFNEKPYDFVKTVGILADIYEYGALKESVTNIAFVLRVKRELSQKRQLNSRTCVGFGQSYREG